VDSYVYGLLGSAAFFAGFGKLLAEEDPSVPVTMDRALFDQVAQLGKRLLWLHTRGARFSDGDALPQALARELRPVTSYPERFHWDARSGTLTIGNGSFGPVDQEVWEFEVSGLKVLQSWLGYRMKAGKGKKSSPLDASVPSAGRSPPSC